MSEATLKSKIPTIDLKNINWPVVFTWFIYSLAVLTLLRGVFIWAGIIGLFESPDFGTSSIGFQTMLVFTAITSLLAGVGLWTHNKWGTVLWLFMLIIVLFYDFYARISVDVSSDLQRPLYKSFFDLLQIVIYFSLSLLSDHFDQKHLQE